MPLGTIAASDYHAQSHPSRHDLTDTVLQSKVKFAQFDPSFSRGG